MAQTDAERQLTLTLVAVIMTSVSVLVVLARIAVRSFVIRKPGMDDYTIIVALFLTIGYMLEILVERENRQGFPASTLTSTQMTNQLKVTLSIQVTYYLIVGFIKMSIVYLYLRFAVSEGFRSLCYGTIIFTFVFTTICLSVTFSQCSPLEKMWDITGLMPGSCINTTAFFYTTSGINIATDLWILGLPIKTLQLANRPVKEIIALGFIFGAGILATILSCIRLQSIYVYTLATDPFRDGIPINLWSMLEVNIAILCASIPALRPIFTPERFRELRDRNIYHRRKHDEDDSNQRGSHRKPSDVSLYPDLETYNLTTFSRSQSPTGSTTFARDDQNDTLERLSTAHARPDPYENDDLNEHSIPNKPAFHAM